MFTFITPSVFGLVDAEFVWIYSYWGLIFLRKGLYSFFLNTIVSWCPCPSASYFSAKKGIIYNGHSVIDKTCYTNFHAAEIKSYLDKPAALFLKICKTVTDKAIRRNNNNK